MKKSLTKPSLNWLKTLKEASNVKVTSEPYNLEKDLNQIINLLKESKNNETVKDEVVATTPTEEVVETVQTESEVVNNESEN